MEDKALVLLSGGMDSCWCLFWAKSRFKEVDTITFHYSQRHIKEIEMAYLLARTANVSNFLMPVPQIPALGDSALVRPGSVSEKHRYGDLPASFVPGRNILFLTLAGMYAFKLGTHNLVGGMSQEDYSGYPDCREEAIRPIDEALSQGMDYPLAILTPLMYKSKAQSLLEASEECLKAMKYTQTCYEGLRPPCRKCPSCLLREKAYKEAGLEDPLLNV